MIINEYVDKIDTFEACYKHIYKSGSDLLIPLVNVGICDHPLNPFPIQNMKFLNECYIKLIDVAIVVMNEDVIYHSANFDGTYDTYKIGGTNVDQKVMNIFSILCKKAFIQIEDSCVFSESYNEFACTSVVSKDILSFLQLKKIPENLQFNYLNVLI